jgi:hypothetical protein
LPRAESNSAIARIVKTVYGFVDLHVIKSVYPSKDGWGMQLFRKQ